jgi:hypothetical protein
MYYLTAIVNQPIVMNVLGAHRNLMQVIFGQDWLSVPPPQPLRSWRFTMIARNVTMRLKPNSQTEFTQTLERDVLPILRRQKGFDNEVLLVGSGSRDAVGISFWDKQESADAYNRDSYPEVLKALAKVLEGMPQVQNYEVATSTFPKTAPAK